MYTFMICLNRLPSVLGSAGTGTEIRAMAKAGAILEAGYKIKIQELAAKKPLLSVKFFGEKTASSSSPVLTLKKF